MKTMKITLLSLVLLMSMILGIYVYQHTNRTVSFEEKLVHATYVQPGRTLASFQLNQTDGQVLSLSNLIGHWTIFFFGYTQCHSICPTTMDMLHKTYDILRKEGVKNLPEMVMISLDGERDSIETMKRYVQGFDREFKGAIGPKRVINQLSQELGIVYDTQINSQDGQIDHSGTITVINPAGEVVAFFIPPMQAKDVAKDITTLMQSY